LRRSCDGANRIAGSSAWAVPFAGVTVERDGLASNPVARRGQPPPVGPFEEWRDRCRPFVV